MWILKALHFTANAGLAGVYLYQSYLYFEYFHLTKDQVGLLGSIVPVVSLFSMPSLMYIAERSLIFNMKNMMIICVFLGSLAWSGQILVQRDTQYTVISLSILVTFSACAIGALGSFLDAITLRVLDDPKDYGKQKLYASIAWGSSSLITGMLIDHFHDIWWSVYVYIAWAALFFVISLFIDYKHQSLEEIVYEPINDIDQNQSFCEIHTQQQCVIPDQHQYCAIPDDQSSATEQEEDFILNYEQENEIRTNHLHDTPIVDYRNETLFQAICKTKIILFFTVVSLLGMVIAVIQSYLFIYLATTWQASSTFLGMTTPFSVFWELPLFFFADFLLKKLGTSKMLILAHFLMLLRLSLYMFLPSLVPISYSYCMLFVEFLHGATFGLYWSAGIEIVQILANPVYKHTFVGIFCSLSTYAGGIFGNIVGGIIYENFGYFYLWLSCLCFVFLSLGLFLLSTRLK